MSGAAYCCVTVLDFIVTAVCENNLPLTVAPLFNAIDV